MSKSYKLRHITTAGGAPTGQDRLLAVWEKWRHLDALLSSDVDHYGSYGWDGPILPRYVAHDLWLAVKAAMAEDLR